MAKIDEIRASVRAVELPTERGWVFAALHDAGRIEEKKRLLDQIDRYVVWVNGKARKGAFDVNPSCKLYSVRYHTSNIRSLNCVLQVMAHKLNHLDGEDAEHMMNVCVTLYEQLFYEYGRLIDYLNNGNRSM